MTGGDSSLPTPDSGVHDTVGSSLDAAARLFDLSTGLPSLTTLFRDLRPFASASSATILYIHLPTTELIEERFGWEALEAYTALVTTYLNRCKHDLRGERQHCVVARGFADDYVMFLPGRSDDRELPQRLSEGMNRHLQAIDEELAALHRVYVGRASTAPFAKIHPERRIYRAIQRAQQEATNVRQQKISSQGQVLDRCIEQAAFRMVYQPLVKVEDLSILAYEALVRCDQEELKNPHVLFDVAEKSGRLWTLSRLLRRMAVEAVSALPGDGRLMFVNLHPDDFEDPQLLALEPFVVEHAERLVFEVTERATIADFDLFRSNIAVLRESGVRIAVDDLGSGYAALNSVAELSPDYIKFDITLIRDIDSSPIRQNLLRNMIAFARDTGALTVGEGVETKAELRTLRELGCHYVQGYYLARPAPEFIDAIDDSL